MRGITKHWDPLRLDAAGPVHYENMACRRLVLWHNCGMTDIFRVRVERKLLKEAARVAEEIGTTPAEIVRIMFAQLVKRRAVPFPLAADVPEAQGLLDVQRRNRILRDLDDSEGW